MVLPRAVVLLAAAALAATPLRARADTPQPSAPAARPAAAPRPTPRETARGAVIVALGDDAAAAARPLAVAVYRDRGLRPDIDDATARVLAGEPVPEGTAPDRMR